MGGRERRLGTEAGELAPFEVVVLLRDRAGQEEIEETRLNVSK
jgi:hypothetical protein